MFNLIRRDVILQKKLILTFIPFILFFIIMDSHPALIFLVASIFIPFNAYAYDEKAEVNILLNSLPYTRSEIIASRYLGAIIYMLLSIGVTSLALFVFNRPFTMTDISIGGGLFLMFAAFTFPLFYIFKQGSITMIVIVSFLILAAVGPAFVRFLATHLPAITDFIVNSSTSFLYAGATVVVLTLYALSWGVTTFIYQRKAF
ncbi:ABC-2 transporter permease [Alkalihalobacterium chitinilyticum]|uniref:ABC-2 transporter permease n=1 Tax=Alkalihalobacterium chitinilyticum TaxID=2980103 RepID=A0ABT5VGQ8_9BACI|nr:ABC-2 transporter permease [Alkalihalobacterium chitinilyticum]MDE5414361.1 ABC-2 transporter permease [Alkalihalobacterium chitinilyticum]